LRTEAEVLGHFGQWAGESDLVRAAVLTSSRVHPDAPVDELSDYDIELYVRDLAPFVAGDAWLEAFGSVLVRWPVHPRSTGRDDWITRLVLFRDGVRIDFQITAKTVIEPDAYRNGYRVLVDKDSLARALNPPAHDEFIIRKPSREAFETRAQEFWWDATYVPKYLARDEVPFAKFMLDHVLRHGFLDPMVEWHIGVRTGWSVNPGIHGRWFKRHLDEATWSQLEATYSGAGIGDNVCAFRSMLGLYRKLGRGVAHFLGYAYPEALDRDVSAYCESVLARAKGSTPASPLVEPYNPEWPNWFDRIAAHLQARLGEHDARIEHVGSTAVLGMVAKPIIDLDVVIPAGAFAGVRQALQGLGYVHQGDQGLPGREAFDLVDPSARNRLPKHHLYVCEEGAAELTKHLAYRAFMRRHPEWRDRLNELKLRLCKEHDNDRRAYIQGKSAMVEEITRLALRESAPV